jgi:hypothetical protein
MTIDESLQVANHFPKAKIVPLHFEGWEHFTESRSAIEQRFKTAGLLDRLQWAE